MKRGAPNLILSGRGGGCVGGGEPQFRHQPPSVPPSPLVPRPSFTFRILGSDDYSGHH